MSRKNKIRDSVADRVFQVVVVVIVTIITLTCILPIINILASSLSSANANNANAVTFWPIEITLDAYKSVVTNGALIRSMFFSIYITILTVAITLVMTILCAYPLSHRDLVGKSILWPFIMFTMYFTAGTIPDYLLMNQLHMLDTIWCLILPLCFAPYNLLIMKNNFQGSIPESLIESARLDGASHFTILGKIVVPLSKPIMATIALFYAVGRWNAYSDALYYIKQNVALRPLQLKLYYLIVAASESFQTEGVATVSMTNPEVLKAACIIFAAVPIICVYPFIQKYFVQGTMVGAVKG